MDSFRLGYSCKEISSKFERSFAALQGLAKVGLNHLNGRHVVVPENR